MGKPSRTRKALDMGKTISERVASKCLRELDEYGYITLWCGCNVAADEVCPHGNPSPLLTAGLI